MDYEIVSYELSSGHEMLVLSNGGRTFIEELSSDPKKQVTARDVYKAADRIASLGIEWALKTETLKTINSSISLLELRIRGKVTRVMVYLHDDSLPVYLFDFKGHQGKRGRIKPNILNKAERLAIEAEKAMREDEGL